MSEDILKLSFRCTACGGEHPVDTFNWRCPNCSGPFVLSGTPFFAKDEINVQNYTLWRYRNLLAVETPISLGEGWTPLLPVEHYGSNVLCKLEFLSPTGSFKDRGIAPLTSFLKMIGVSQVVENSSGNAAASLAAYCARAEIRAKIYVPTYASPGKLRQIQAYGAELVPVPGSRIEATRAAEAAAKAGTYYASHYWNPFVLEGLKTFAYELVEQLDWHCPDNIVFPCGHGTLLLGAYYGFCKLVEARVSSQLPRLFAVQAAACAPIVAAYEAGLSVPRRVEARDTMAEGIRIAEPARGREILAALKKTDGGALLVGEDEIRQAHQELSRGGLYVEWTSSVAMAGLQNLMATGAIGQNERTVVALTGSGLKNLANA